jgi:hypothetical protein
MLDPSDALPIVIAEFIEPTLAETAAIVQRMAPELDAEHVRWCVMSVMGQAIFYRFTMPASVRVLGLRNYSPTYSRRLAAHIAEFSAGGIGRVAAARRKRAG